MRRFQRARSISDKTRWQLLGGQCHNLGSFPCCIIDEIAGEGQTSWLYSIFELRRTLKDGGRKYLLVGLCDRRQPLQRTLLGCGVRSREQGTFTYGGNAEGLLRTRRARNTINIILGRNQARRHWVYSGNYPEHSLLPRTHETQKPSINQGLTDPATTLISFND
jgi:hypothetical protein